MKNLLQISGLSLALSACGQGTTINGDAQEFLAQENIFAPKIELNGPEVLRLEAGLDSYQEFGAVARSLQGGELSSQIQILTDLQVDRLGTYSVVYRLGSSEKVRRVIVQDTLAPSFELRGASLVSHERLEVYSDAGATEAIDSFEGEVSVNRSGSVLSDAVGVYTLQFRATDTSGNLKVLEREVQVNDTRAPTSPIAIDSSDLSSPSSDLRTRVVSLSDPGNPLDPIKFYKSIVVPGQSCDGLDFDGISPIELTQDNEIEFTPSGVGYYTVCVRAADEFANYQGVVASATLRIEDNIIVGAFPDLETITNDTSSRPILISRGGSDAVEYRARLVEAENCDGVSLSGSWRSLAGGQATFNTGTLFSDSSSTAPIPNIVCAEGRNASGDIQSQLSASESGPLFTDTKRPDPVDVENFDVARTSSLSSKVVTITPGTDVVEYQALLHAGTFCPASVFDGLSNWVSISGPAEFNTGEFPSFPGEERSYVVCAIGRDLVGNLQTGISSNDRIIIDQSAPSAVLVESFGVSGGVTNNGGPYSITVTRSVLDTAQVRVKLEAAQSCGSVEWASVPWVDLDGSGAYELSDVQLVADSYNIICAQGRDTAGNIQAGVSDGGSVFYDATLPGLISVGAFAVTLKNNTDSERIVISKNGSDSVEYRARLFADRESCAGGDVESALEAIGWTSFSGETAEFFTGVLSANTHNIVCAQGRDAAGNIQAGVSGSPQALYVDTVMPEITMLGANPLDLQLCEIYNDIQFGPGGDEPGASATDDRDGVLSVEVSFSETGHLKVQSFNVIYTATDLAGNEASVSREVSVQPIEVDQVEFNVGVESPGGLDSLRDGDLDENYILCGDIDFIAQPLGHEFRALDELRGQFEGQSFKILGLEVMPADDEAADFSGLFRKLSSSAKVSNLTIESASVFARGVSGVLTGLNQGEITRVLVTLSEIVGTRADGSFYDVVAGGFGGIAGVNQQGGIITESFAQVDIFGDFSVAGLVARNFGEIENSYARSRLFRLDSGQAQGEFAGLVAQMSSSNATLRNSYSDTELPVSLVGLEGVGGLVAINSQADSVFSSYWNSDLYGGSGSDPDKYGEAKTPAELRQQASFDGWDFFSIWNIEEGIGFPFLRFEP